MDLSKHLGISEKLDEIRFYRSKGEWGFLSNLFKVEVILCGKSYRSAEDAYQYQKPRENKVANWLISAPEPRFTALAAHSLLFYDIVPNWKQCKENIMLDVLRAKFTQNSDLADKLLQTENKLLIEDSKTDSFWGIGKGNGKNMLGKLLMQVREELLSSTNGGLVEKMSEELETTSKWRYLRIQFWLARIEWWRAERSVRKGPLIKCRKSK